MKKKNAIVTGISSGIGKAIAEKLISDDVNVFGLDRKEANLIGAENYLCDVSNENEVIKVINEIKKSTLVVDYLVNVAGVLNYGQRTLIENQSISDWNELLKINLTSVLIMMKHVCKLMPPNSSIVNISSEQSLKVISKSSPYSVSKAGINILTKVAALEMGEKKIRVNAIAAGTVKTNILRTLIDNDSIIEEMYKNEEKKLLFGVIKAEDIANLVIYLLSDKANFITGEVILADSGKMLL